MKKLLVVLTLVVAVLASQAAFAQDKPAEKKDQKTAMKCEHKKGENCQKCEAMAKKDSAKCEMKCCAKSDESKKDDVKKDETKKDDKK